MCGRFALEGDLDFVHEDLRRREIRTDAQVDGERQRRSYNVAPQSFSPVVRQRRAGGGSADGAGAGTGDAQVGVEGERETVIQVMKWGLVPFWTKRAPDSNAMLRTINARDDSVLNGGLWKSSRERKRCVVPIMGFYEWLKKSGGDKAPYYVRHRDSRLMLLAGLYDSVSYDDPDRPADPERPDRPLFTFTIITTSSSKALSFLHDRMPVILNSLQDVETWLDLDRPFDASVAKLMRPFEETDGDAALEIYEVPHEVGKVGRSDPDFIKPIDQRKGNIRTMFQKQSPDKAARQSKADGGTGTKSTNEGKVKSFSRKGKPADDEETRKETASVEEPELPINPDEGDQTRAPLPGATKEPDKTLEGPKLEHQDDLHLLKRPSSPPPPPSRMRQKSRRVGLDHDKKLKTGEGTRDIKTFFK